MQSDSTATAESLKFTKKIFVKYHGTTPTQTEKKL